MSDKPRIPASDFAKNPGQAVLDSMGVEQLQQLLRAEGIRYDDVQDISELKVLFSCKSIILLIRCHDII